MGRAGPFWPEVSDGVGRGVMARNLAWRPGPNIYNPDIRLKDVEATDTPQKVKLSGKQLLKNLKNLILCKNDEERLKTEPVVRRGRQVRIKFRRYENLLKMFHFLRI